MQLDGDICRLRRWQDSDAESIARHGDSRNVWRNLRDTFPHPYTLDDARDWIARTRHPGLRDLQLAIDVQGEAAGAIGAEMLGDCYRFTAEVGYWIGEAFWGRGMATDALRIYTAYLFQYFAAERAQGRVFAWNPASGRVLEKAGYAREGIMRRACMKDGEFVDVVLYGITRGDLGSEGRA